MTVDQQELSNINAGREVFYSLFSRAYIEPIDSNFFVMLKEILASVQTSGTHYAELLLTCINERDSLSGDAKEEFDNTLLRTYTRLFCMSDSMRVTESAYTSSSGLTKQDACSAVIKTYSKYNIEQKEIYNEDEDHIAHELGFMAWLCDIARRCGSREATLEVLKDQHSFMQDHILKWFGTFNTTLQKWETESRLYHHLSAFMMEFIADDSIFLDEVCS